MIPIILETPYAGDVEKNKKYARACMLDCLKRGEAPMVSHLLYTQCLDDNMPRERELGMKAGFAWRKKANYTVVYLDLGTSEGMAAGIEHARNTFKIVKYRKLRGEWEENITDIAVLKRC